MEREGPNHLIRRMKALLINGATFHVDGKIVPIRRVVTGTLPCVRATLEKKDADMATMAVSDRLSWRRSPTRSRRKEVRKDQLLS